MEEKLIPQNIAAEQSVLGALLIDKTAINRVRKISTALHTRLPMRPC